MWKKIFLLVAVLLSVAVIFFCLPLLRKPRTPPTVASAALVPLVVTPAPEVAKSQEAASSLSINPFAEKKKASIAVGPTYFRAGAGYGGESELKSFRDMLTTSLMHSEKFDVVERDRLGDVFGEINLNQGKGFDQLSTAALGKLKGVNYLFLGSITQLAVTPRVNRTNPVGGGNSAATVNALSGLASSFLGTPSVHIPEPSTPPSPVVTVQNVANITVDMKIVEVATGKIVIADAVQAYAAGPMFQGGVAYPNDATTLTNAVMRNIAQDIVKRISTAVYPIKIASIQGDAVILNYGDSILAQGDVIDVFTQGAKVVDPDTGAVLTNSEEKIGLIRVDSADRTFSKGTILVGKDKLLVGAVCKVNPDSKITKTSVQVQ